MGYENAARNDITVDKGSTYQETYTIKDEAGDPVDLSSYTGEMDIRISSFSSDTLYQIDTTTGNMILGGAAGTIAITMPESVTSTWTATTYTYDLKLTNGSGVSEFILYGNLLVNQTVTR